MKKIKIVLIILLLGIIGFETYYFITLKHDDVASPSLKEEDNSRYLVDVTTPYKEDNIEYKLNKINDTTYYYTIDGLLDKSVQDTVNNKLTETVNKLKDEYQNVFIGGTIYSNFENTLSYVFESYLKSANMTGEKYAEQIEFRKRNNFHEVNTVIYTLNFDLTTGKELTIKDVLNDRTTLKTKLLTNLYEDASKLIGLVCSGGPCENPNPNYSPLEDGVLSVMNQYSNDKYFFYYEPTRISLYFTDVYLSNPEIVDYGLTKDECLQVPNATWENMGYDEYYCINQKNYDTTYGTYIPFYELTDDVIIYNKFQTDKTIYKNESTEIKRKFTYNNKYKSYIEEQDNAFIDYEVEYYGKDDFLHKIYNDVTKEMKGLQTNGFNLYHVSGTTSYLNDNFEHIQFDVYHYDLPKDVFNSYKSKIYLDKFINRYTYPGFDADIVYQQGYDYLNQYLTKKAYYYYIYDENGNAVETKDVLSDTFDFSSIIPNEWVANSNYKDLNEMLEKAYIVCNTDYQNANRLIFYITYGEVSIKYKNKKITLADGQSVDNWSQIGEWTSKILK